MENPHARPSSAQIEDWIGYEEKALADVRAELRPLLDEESRIGERLSGLRHLLATYDPTTTPTGSRHTASREGSDGQSVAERVRGQVRELLRDASAPMHINDIHSAFLTRGWVVPGAGKPANITAHLSNAPDIMSPTRGLYRLLWDYESRPTRPQRTHTAARRTTRLSSKKK